MKVALKNIFLLYNFKKLIKNVKILITDYHTFFSTYWHKYLSTWNNSYNQRHLQMLTLQQILFWLLRPSRHKKKTLESRTLMFHWFTFLSIMHKSRNFGYLFEKISRERHLELLRSTNMYRMLYILKKYAFCTY